MRRTPIKRDIISSGAQLFHHLANARTLRSNVLARGWFDPAGKAWSEATTLLEVRDRIKRVAQAVVDEDSATNNAELGQRRYTIFVRCDLNREPRKVVAQDLGISTRQFSRDRAIMRERIFERLKEQRNTLSVSDTEPAALAHAFALYELGKASASAHQFGRIASESRSPLRSTQALLALTEIEIDFDRFDSAERILASIRSASEPFDMPTRNAGHVAILLGAARLAVERSNVEKADRLFRQLEFSLVTVRPLTHPECEILAAAHCALAWRQSERGNLTAGLGHVACAFGALESWKALSLMSRERLRHLHTLLSYHTGTIKRETARQDLLSLLLFSQSAGWLRQSAILFGALATDVNESSNTERYAAEAKSLSRRHGSPQLRRITALASSLVAVSNGNCSQANRDLGTWRRFGSSDMFQRVIAADIDARIAMVAQAYSKAFAHAEHAFSTAKHLGSTRAMGSALRTMAAIEFKRGKHCDAREHIETAITLIKGHGSPGSLERAVLLRDRIADVR